MSEELPYRSLAAVSIAKVQEQALVPTSDTQIEEGGRFYATIHRSSPLMPQSLRQGEEQEVVGDIGRAAVEMFVIPKMNW